MTILDRAKKICKKCFSHPMAKELSPLLGNTKPDDLKHDYWAMLMLQCLCILVFVGIGYIFHHLGWTGIVGTISAIILMLLPFLMLLAIDETADGLFFFVYGIGICLLWGIMGACLFGEWYYFIVFILIARGLIWLTFYFDERINRKDIYENQAASGGISIMSFAALYLCLDINIITVTFFIMYLAALLYFRICEKVVYVAIPIWWACEAIMLGSSWKASLAILFFGGIIMAFTYYQRKKYTDY